MVELISFRISVKICILTCSIFLFSSSVNIDSDEEFLTSGQNPVLTIMSAGHALHVFINGHQSGLYPTHATHLKY